MCVCLCVYLYVYVCDVWSLRAKSNYIQIQSSCKIHSFPLPLNIWKSCEHPQTQIPPVHVWTYTHARTHTHTHTHTHLLTYLLTYLLIYYINIISLVSNTFFIIILWELQQQHQSLPQLIFIHLYQLACLFAF